MDIYFNPFAGVSGDMFCGALIDAGADFTYIHSVIEALGLNIELSAGKTVKDGIACTKFSVIDHNTGKSHDEHTHRSYKDIKELLVDKITDRQILDDSLGVFELLAKAEAKVHGIDIEDVHFHEVGAVDSIADIVSGVCAIHSLTPLSITCGPVNIGSGTVKCEHGVLPVPAPATLELLRNCPVYSDGTVGELITPTGAALIKYYVQKFGAAPYGVVKTAGYGAGTATFTIPNLFRVIVY